MPSTSPADHDTRQLAQDFSLALQKMEQTRDVGELAGFFAGGAVLSNLGAEHDLQGSDGVQKFWTAYVEQFAEVHTEFGETTVAPDAVILEWHSEGKEAGGREIAYRGVSILKLDEAKKISAFRTYYDSAAFVAK